MPTELLEAHARLDAGVDTAFGVRQPLDEDLDRQTVSPSPAMGDGRSPEDSAGDARTRVNELAHARRGVDGGDEKGLLLATINGITGNRRYAPIRSRHAFRRARDCASLPRRTDLRLNGRRHAGMVYAIAANEDGQFLLTPQARSTVQPSIGELTDTLSVPPRPRPQRRPSHHRP